jgi:multiple sugar transport system permease protein
MVRVTMRGAQRRRDIRTAYLLLAPAVLLLLTVLAYPVGWEVWTSLTSFSPLQEGGTAFVGVHNYRQQLEDPQFWRTAIVTVV